MIVTPLTFTEEILLLLLGEEDGAFLPVNSSAFECALAGATLMNLAFALRIDTDLTSLIVLNENPTGIATLDRILAKDRRPPESDGRAVLGEIAGQRRSQHDSRGAVGEPR